MNEKQAKKYTDTDSYQIGSTQPPASHTGVVAFLLSLVILLMGLVSVLGIQNFHLFRALQADSLSSLSDATANTTVTQFDSQPCLGIWGEEISTVSQYFFQLPAGLRITKVSGNADMQGIRTGDILLKVNDLPVTSEEEFRHIMESLQVGDAVSVTVYRNKQQLQFTLQVEVLG
jgi:hypothetical protein